MEAVEIPAMIAALILMFGAVGAKIVTTQLIGRMNNQISHVEQAKRESLGHLKGAQNQKSAAEQNMNMLATQKGKITKKLNRLKKEEAQFKEEDQQRRQKMGVRKVE